METSSFFRKEIVWLLRYYAKVPKRKGSAEEGQRVLVPKDLLKAAAKLIEEMENELP